MARIPCKRNNTHYTCVYSCVGCGQWHVCGYAGGGSTVGAEGSGTRLRGGLESSFDTVSFTPGARLHVHMWLWLYVPSIPHRLRVIPTSSTQSPGALTAGSWRVQARTRPFVCGTQLAVLVWPRWRWAEGGSSGACCCAAHASGTCRYLGQTYSMRISALIQWHAAFQTASGAFWHGPLSHLEP